MINRYEPEDLCYQLACGNHSRKESERTVPGQMSALGYVVDLPAFWKALIWRVYYEVLLFHLEMLHTCGSPFGDEVLLQVFAVSGPDFSTQPGKSGRYEMDEALPQEMLATHLFFSPFSEVFEQDASASEQANLQDVERFLYCHGSSSQKVERAHHKCPRDSSSRGPGSVLQTCIHGSCIQQEARDHRSRAADVIDQARRQCGQIVVTKLEETHLEVCLPHHFVATSWLANTCRTNSSRPRFL